MVVKKLWKGEGAGGGGRVLMAFSCHAGPSTKCVQRGVIIDKEVHSINICLTKLHFQSTQCLIFSDNNNIIG